MPRATTIVRRAAVRADRVADAVSLDHAGRAAAHGHLATEGGLTLEVALTKAAALEDGDALRLEDGRLVTVRAAEEALLEVRAENPARLMRLAWQLGGSHVPAEIASDVLYVPATAAELVRGQGCTASPVTRAFRPERAAHDHSTCGHDHGHAHGGDHAHGHVHEAHDHGTHAHAGHDHGDHTHGDHAHAHDGHGHDHHDHGHGHHAHGPGCNHDH